MGKIKLLFEKCKIIEMVPRRHSTTAMHSRAQFRYKSSLKEEVVSDGRSECLEKTWYRRRYHARFAS